MNDPLLPPPAPGGTSSLESNALRSDPDLEFEDMVSMLTIQIALDDMDENQRRLYAVLAWAESGKVPVLRKLLLYVVTIAIVGIVVLAASRDYYTTVLTVLGLSLLAGFLLGRRSK